MKYRCGNTGEVRRATPVPPFNSCDDDSFFPAMTRVLLWEQAVDEALDVEGIDASVEIDVAAAADVTPIATAGIGAVEEQIDKELDIQRVDVSVAVRVARRFNSSAKDDSSSRDYSPPEAYTPPAACPAMGFSKTMKYRCGNTGEVRRATPVPPFNSCDDDSFFPAMTRVLLWEE